MRLHYRNRHRQSTITKLDSSKLEYFEINLDKCQVSSSEKDWRTHQSRAEISLFQFVSYSCLCRGISVASLSSVVSLAFVKSLRHHVPINKKITQYSVKNVHKFNNLI